MTPTSRSVAVVGLVSLFAGLLVLVGGGFGIGTPGNEREDAYSELVRSQFIDKGRLIVHERVAAGSEIPIVDLADRIYRGDDEVALNFAAQSFLLDDIRRNDPSIWTIENGKVTDISPFMHNAPLPFSSQRNFRGDLLYSRPFPATGRDQIILRPADWDGPVLSFPVNSGRLVTGDPRIGLLDLSRPSLTTLSKAAFNVICGVPKKPLATISRIGDQIAVSVRSLGCETEVDKHRLGREFTAIGPDSRLVFIDPTGKHFAYDRIDPAPSEKSLSTVLASGERYRAAEAAQLAETIERDYVRALPPEPESSLQEAIRLTLDPEIQPAVQNLLVNYIQQRRWATNKPLIGAVTVMDAISGDILALGTYPTPQQVSSTVADEDDRTLKAAQRNQNFELLPIGSAAKPLVAAAILAKRPDLLSLRIISEGGKVDNLLGMKLPSPRELHGHGNEIGFDQFIEYSDNDYAASILLLASADRDSTEHVPLPPNAYYRLNGTRYSWRVKSIFERPDGQGGYVTTSPQSERQLAWAEMFEQLYDVSAAGRGSHEEMPVMHNCVGGGNYFGDDSYDAGLWRNLLFARPTLNACGFKESAPYREALGITAAKDFRRDLLTVMLGNGEGRWSAVKVAESYARLVTGRRVVANLVSGPHDPPGRITPDFPARTGLTHALTLVIHGTASRTGMPDAFKVLRQDSTNSCLAVGAFSKTGTPTLPEAEYEPADNVINWLIRQDRLHFDPGSRAVLLISPNGNLHIREDGIALRELRSSAEVAYITKVFHSTTKAVIARLMRYNEKLSNNEAPYVIMRGNLLVRVASRTPIAESEDDPSSKGKVYALVVGAYRLVSSKTGVKPLSEITDGSREPLRAYSIVVNLQFPDKTAENAAADIAARIVTEIIRPIFIRVKRECSI